MKVFEQGGYETNYWVRLFSFGKNEQERALVSFEIAKDTRSTFCLIAQIGGDCFAEVGIHAFNKSLVVNIWSV